MRGAPRVLRRRREIDELFRCGKRHRGRLMTVTTMHDDGEEGGVLFAVSKRVGTAVVRNRVRRRMREAFRALLRGQQIRTNVALVAHPPAATVGFGELVEEMERLLRQSGVLVVDRTGQGDVG